MRRLVLLPTVQRTLGQLEVASHSSVHCIETQPAEEWTRLRSALARLAPHAARKSNKQRNGRTCERRLLVPPVVPHALHELRHVVQNYVIPCFLAQHLDGARADCRVCAVRCQHVQRFVDGNVAPLLQRRGARLCFLQASDTFARCFLSKMFVTQLWPAQHVAMQARMAQLQGLAAYASLTSKNHRQTIDGQYFEIALHVCFHFTATRKCVRTAALLQSTDFRNGMTVLLWPAR